MANPFRVFRKKKKVLLAVIGVLTMISFIIIPALMQQMGARGGSGGAHSIAVKTKEFGSLNNLEMNKLYEQHRIMSRFLQTMAQQMYSQALGIAQSGDKNMMQQAMAAYQQSRIVSNALQQLGPNDERVLVMRWVAANKARKMGLAVNEAMVQKFIEDLDTGMTGDGKTVRFLGNQGIIDIFKSMNPGRPVQAELMVVQSFTDFLLCNEMQSVLGSPFGGLTTSEKWAAFCRMNKMASIEALPVKVEDFLAKIGEPSEKQIRQFFAQYKDKDADLEKAEPGLKQPKRIKVEYCVANPSAFIDEKAVTEEQIKEEYEKTKDMYYVSESLSNLPGDLPAGTDFLNAIAPKAEEAAPAEAPKAEEAASAEAPKAEEAAPAEAPKAEEAAPAEAPKAEEAAPVEAPKAEEAAPAEAPKAEEAAPAEAPKAEEAAPAEAPKAEEAAPAEAPKAEEAAPAEAPKAEEAAPAEAPKAEENQQTAVRKPFIREVVNPESPAASLAPKTYRPLDEVKDEVRHRVAMNQANEKLRAAMTAIQQAMSKYSADLDTYDIEYAMNKDKAVKPAALDLKKLAEANKVNYVVTELISFDALKDSPLANARLDGDSSNVSAMQQLFGKTLLNRASMYSDQEGNLYVAWKTEEVKAHVPTLDEKNIREQVIDQWKYIEARKLAEQDAQDKLGQLTKGKKSLKDTFGDAVIVPPQFSCLTFGAMRVDQTGNMAPVRLSDVQGIDSVDYGFMRSVFELLPGDSAVVANKPQSVFYVVQMKELTPSYDQLYSRFLATPNNEYIQSAAYEIRTVDAKQQNQVEEEAGLVWVRNPRTIDGDSEE